MIKISPRRDRDLYQQRSPIPRQDYACFIIRESIDDLSRPVPFQRLHLRGPSARVPDWPWIRVQQWDDKEDEEEARGAGTSEWAAIRAITITRIIIWTEKGTRGKKWHARGKIDDFENSYFLLDNFHRARDESSGSGCSNSSRDDRHKGAWRETRSQRVETRGKGNACRKGDTVARESIVSRSLANESYVRFGYGNTAFQPRHLSQPASQRLSFVPPPVGDHDA